MTSSTRSPNCSAPAPADNDTAIPWSCSVITGALGAASGQPEDPLGAKPKAPTSSTPSIEPAEGWSAIGRQMPAGHQRPGPAMGSSPLPLHLMLDCSRAIDRWRGIALLPAPHSPGPQAAAAHAKHSGWSSSAGAAPSLSQGGQTAVTHLAASDHRDAAAERQGAANTTSPQHPNKPPTTLIN
eukprot:superscaffoldBa00000564_g5661